MPDEVTEAVANEPPKKSARRSDADIAAAKKKTALRQRKAVSKMPFRKLSDIKSRPVPWVLESYIPKECVTLVVGKYAMGKSTLMLWLAENSNGHSWMNSLEGGAEFSLVPRAQAAKVTGSKVLITDNRWDLSTAQAAEEVDRFLSEHKDVRIVFFDSLKEHVPGFQSNDPSKRAVEQLDLIAQKRHVAIVFIHHFTKGGTKDITRAVGGSSLWQDLARAIFVLGPSERPESRLEKLMGIQHTDEQMLALACLKLTYDEEPATMLFKRTLVYNEETGKTMPVLEYAGTSDDTAEQVYLAGRRQHKTDPDAVEAAAIWLIKFLSVQPEHKMASSEFYQVAQAEGISKGSLARARILTDPPLTKAIKENDVWYTQLAWDGAEIVSDPDIEAAS